MPRQGRLQSLSTPLWRLSLSRSSMARLDTEATEHGDEEVRFRCRRS